MTPDTSNYLFLGYAVIWLGIFLYMLSLGRREAELEKDVRLLKDVRAQAEKRPELEEF